MTKRLHLTPEERDSLLADILKHLKEKMVKMAEQCVERALSESNAVASLRILMKTKADELMHSEFMPQIQRHVIAILDDIDRRYPKRPRRWAQWLFQK